MARDTSFYYAFLMLPPAKRNAIVVVWDFCRAVDDAVDEAVPTWDGALPAEARAKAEAELLVWREDVRCCFETGPDVPAPSTRQGRALRPLVAAFGLKRQPFDDLIDGVAMDLERRQYETIGDLLEYCRRVASAVGLICIEIFGCRDAAARDYAINLGIALQLTNIVRDVGVDLQRGRVYLPQEDLRRFGCTEEDLRRGVVTEPVKALLAFEISPGAGILSARGAGAAACRCPPARRCRDHGRDLPGDPAPHRTPRLRRLLAGDSRPAAGPAPRRDHDLGPHARRSPAAALADGFESVLIDVRWAQRQP